jgi:cytoskeletal protein RodZ
LALTHDRDDRDPKLKLGDGPALKAIGSVANTLRGAREEHGQDLHAVAQVLRIRYDYLEAIETGAFERLPGTTYAHGFLRTYAEFLGLDGDEMVERFKQEMHGTERQPELAFPEPVTEGRIPGGAIILISAVLLGLAYGGWFYLSNQGKSVADLIPPLPERLQAMLTGAAETVLESASVDEPVGSGQASEYAPPEAESGEPSVLADPAEEPTPDSGVVASAPEESGTTVAVAEAPAAAEPADFESDAARAAGSETETTDTTVDSAPVAPSPEPEASTQERVAATEPVEPVTAATEPVEPATAAARPEPVRSEPAPTPSVDPRPDPADSAASPPPVTATAPAKVVTAEPAQARRTAAITAPLVEQTLVIPAPPAAPQSMVSTDRSPRVYGESTEATRIVLRALQDSWVQIRDRQDALLLTRVLRAGDSYFVPARDGLTLLTGNAGGLEIRVDGVPVPPIGPVGTVRRQIALDPARLLSGAAAPR